MDAKSLVDVALFMKMETMTLGQRRLIPRHKIAARVFAWSLPIKPVPSRLHKKNFSFIPTTLLVLQYNSQAEIALQWHKDASFPVCVFWVLKLTVASQLAPTQTMSVIDLLGFANLSNTEGKKQRVGSETVDFRVRFPGFDSMFICLFTIPVWASVLLSAEWGWQ